MLFAFNCSPKTKQYLDTVVMIQKRKLVRTLPIRLIKLLTKMQLLISFLQRGSL